MNSIKPRFFASQNEFRRWLEINYAKRSELLVGFHKKDSGNKSITYPEALDEALCFGWIDGVRRRLDDSSYAIRFTPRRANSIWSLVNIRKVEELIKRGHMHQAGLDAYRLRDPKRTGVYSFENRPRELASEYEKKFRQHKRAWQFFQCQPPSYKRLATYWVMEGKQEETRLRRLNTLISSAQKNERYGPITGGKR